MIAWLLNLTYLVLVAAGFPLLLFQIVVRGKYRTGWPQKLFGAVPCRSSSKPCIWFHAVSVGEVLQLQTVFDALSACYPHHEFVISTTTTTGYDVARQRYAQHHVIYFPLDFSWSVRRALDRIQPQAIVLVELELWPNFVLSAVDRGIPVLLINGRISQRSFVGYSRIRPLIHALLSRLTVCAVQNEAYAGRLQKLGAAASKITITGSIKFDGVQTDRRQPRTVELRQAFGLSETDLVLIAGSTQGPEEEYALETYLSLRAKYEKC